jgi:hypothetical protein
LQATNDAFVDWDLVTDEAFFSERWFDWTGIEAHSIADWGAIMHPNDVPAFRSRMEALSQGSKIPSLSFELRIRGLRGDWRWVLCRIAVVGEPIVERLVFALTDITQRKQVEADLRQSAFYDHLTGLANRALLLDRMEHLVKQARRRGSTGFSTVLLDLDRFKSINDSLGHAAGDHVLVSLAQRMLATVRPSASVNYRRFGCPGGRTNSGSPSSACSG